jgi:hypothetical protein
MSRRTLKAPLALVLAAAALWFPAGARPLTPDPAEVYRLEARGCNGITLTGERLWGTEPYAVSMHRFFERRIQLWRFEHVADGYYKIICEASPVGEVLTMYQPPAPGKNKPLPPRNAETFAWMGTDNQLWKPIDMGGVWTGLQVKDTGKMLTGVEDPLYPYPSSVWNPVPESTFDAADINQYWQIEVARPLQVNSIALPQTGWSPRAPKTAVLSLTENSTFTPTFSVSGPQTLSGNMLRMGGGAGQEWKYNMATCSANLTALTAPGNYTITVNTSLGNYTAPFEIAHDVYRRVRGAGGSGGIVTVQNMLDGFWRWNTITAPETLLNVSVRSTTPYPPTGGNFTLTTGWYDASSRDAKVARDAVTLSYMILGYQATPDPAARAGLLGQVQLGTDFLLETQSANGSWPVGKVKEITGTSTYEYRWNVNTYTGTTARAVAALAMAAQALRDPDPARADAALAAALTGWSYVLANNTDANFQGPEEVSFRGTSGGVLGAAVELFRATGNTAYRSFAENMISNGTFNDKPAFVGITTPFPGQVDHDKQELESGLAIIALCRHRPFASTTGIATKIDTEANNWRANWANKFIFLPWGIPNNTVNQGFGPNVAHSFLILQHLLVAQAFPNLRNECLARASGSMTTTPAATPSALRSSPASEIGMPSPATAALGKTPSAWSSPDTCGATSARPWPTPCSPNTRNPRTRIPTA